MKNFFALFSLYLKRFCKKCYGRSGFTETYSEPSRMEVFAVKIVNSLSAIFAKVSTLDVWVGSEYAFGFSETTLNLFVCSTVNFLFPTFKTVVL